MNTLTRRQFLWQGAAGLAAIGAGPLLLKAGADPTEPSGDLGGYGAYLEQSPTPARGGERTDFTPTENNILGPFHRPGAPYRAKITPPLSAGTVLLVRGRLWGADTRVPLSGAAIDIWQANHEGRYDNDDPAAPPRAEVFLYRSRVLTDENGLYEYETIHPGRYRIGAGIWRPSHVHYWVRKDGYKPLVTQLYFRGDPHNDADRFIKPSLIIDLERRETPAGAYEAGTFDIVLEPA